MSTAIKFDKFLNDFFKLSLKDADKELYKSVVDEFTRQQNHIELIASENIVSKAKNIKNKLQSLGMGRVLFENSGNIGKNYRRHDEIGTPICITIDFDTLEDGTVTVRDRDTMNQERVKESELEETFKKLF